MDNPAELNEAILKMMLLQETIQIENAGKKKRSEPQSSMITIKRTGSGKFVAGCFGDQKFRYAVETALKASTSLLAVFQRGRFINILKSMGVPEDRIQEYCQSITIDDDTYCIDQEWMKGGGSEIRKRLQNSSGSLVLQRGHGG